MNFKTEDNKLILAGNTHGPLSLKLTSGLCALGIGVALLLGSGGLSLWAAVLAVGGIILIVVDRARGLEWTLTVDRRARRVTARRYRGASTEFSLDDVSFSVRQWDSIKAWPCYCVAAKFPDGLEVFFPTMPESQETVESRLNDLRSWLGVL